MAWINIEHYHIQPSWGRTASGTANFELCNISDASKAFVFNTCNRRSAIGNADGVSNYVDADDVSCLLRIVDENTLEVKILQGGMGATNRRPIFFETWEYIGPIGGDNEFVVIGQYEVELDQIEETTVSVSGVSDYSKCVPFVSAITHTYGEDGADGLTAIAYLTDDSTLKVIRGAGANDKTVVSISLVEFTGANWTVRQAQAQSADDSGEISLPSSVGDWENAFIYHQFKANSANHVDDSISDTSAVYYQDDNVMDKVYWEFSANHADSVGDAIHYVYVVENPDITVYRDESSSNSRLYIDYFDALQTRPAKNIASMMISKYTSGTGTAYPRGWSGAIYTGKYARTWCLYEGNTVKTVAQLIQFGDDVYQPSDDTYEGSVLLNTNIDNYWPMQGNFFDIGSGEWANNFTTLDVCEFVDKDSEASAFGCRSQTQTLKVAGGTDEGMSASIQYMLMCNSPCSNFNDKTQRTLGGWFSLSKIQELYTAIYKEGGGANNIAFLVGFGNMLMAQVDQSTVETKYVQVYSDFPLGANRPYHVALVFEAQNDVKLYIDGKLQQRSFNNPYDTDVHPSHTGPQVIGIDGSIDSGGPDVQYYTPESLFISNWFNTSSIIPEEDIRFYLVEHGLPSLVEIPSGTAADMQDSLDTIAGTFLSDYPLGVRVNPCSDREDLSLVCDNITVHDSMTYHIQWLGSGTLVWKNSNGSNFSISSSLYGGEVVFLNPVMIKVYVYNAKTGVGIPDAAVYFVELDRYEITDSAGKVSFYEFLNQGDSLTVRIRKATNSPYYKPYKIQLEIPNGDIDITAPLIPD